MPRLQDADRPKRGHFIAFEGVDGSGKSSQCSLLATRLRELQISVYETSEPTSSPIGSLIRNIMVQRIQAGHDTIAALFVADRLDHLQNDVNGMCKKLNEGLTVLTDRYYFSSYAYHSLHVPMDWVVMANSLCAEILRPDITIFLDVPPETCIARLNSQSRHLELYERLEDLERIRENYLRAFRLLRDTENVVIVDGAGEKQEVAGRIWSAIKPLLAKEI